MSITPHDFHRMTSLKFDGASISLEDKSDTRLGPKLFGMRYTIETICYIDLKADFMYHPQGMAEECTRMAKVLLLYLLGAYLFANGGKMVSLRWLALFQDFERAQTANWGKAFLAYFYSSLDTLSRGTLHQLVGPWKLLEVSFFPFSLVAHAFSPLWSYIHMPLRLRLYHILANCIHTHTLQTMT